MYLLLQFFLYMLYQLLQALSG